MPQKKATNDAPVTSPPKNECEPTVFQLPTQMWLDMVIKFMIFFSLCDFFAFFFFFFKSDSFIVESFWDFYDGYEAQYQ